MRERVFEFSFWGCGGIVLLLCVAASLGMLGHWGVAEGSVGLIYLFAVDNHARLAGAAYRWRPPRWVAMFIPVVTAAAIVAVTLFPVGSETTNAERALVFVPFLFAAPYLGFLITNAWGKRISDQSPGLRVVGTLANVPERKSLIAAALLFSIDSVLMEITAPHGIAVKAVYELGALGFLVSLVPGRLAWLNRAVAVQTYRDKT